MRRLSVVVALIAILVMAVALPAAAWELQGEHRLMVTQGVDGPELRVAEALVLRHDQWWTELIVTQRWSPARPARLEAEVSVWRAAGDWDYGAGVLWEVTGGHVVPWVMVARPW